MDDYRALKIWKFVEILQINVKLYENGMSGKKIFKYFSPDPISFNNSHNSSRRISRVFLFIKLR